MAERRTNMTGAVRKMTAVSSRTFSLEDEKDEIKTYRCDVGVERAACILMLHKIHWALDRSRASHIDIRRP
jgi:hypothetical protein